MKREVEELTKSQGEMSKQIGLLIGAMALRGPELPRVYEPELPRVQPPEHKGAFAFDDAGELTEAQKQQEQIKRARGLAKCMASLQGFDRTTMTSSSSEGGIIYYHKVTTDFFTG